LYFFVTGVWPLVSIDSFQKLTGPTIDLWLVRTAGVLVGAIGVTLALGARNVRRSPMIDAVAEAVLTVAWLAELTRRRR
jgi:hypothetical protein